MAQPAPARPLRLISACFAVSICFRAFQQEQYHARHLSSGGLSEDLLESNSTEAEECKVNVIADPLHEYFWLNESYSVVIYLFGLAYLFFGLGYVCEEYFVQVSFVEWDPTQNDPTVHNLALLHNLTLLRSRSPSSASSSSTRSPRTWRARLSWPLARPPPSSSPKSSAASFPRRTAPARALSLVRLSSTR